MIFILFAIIYTHVLTIDQAAIIYFRIYAIRQFASVPAIGQSCMPVEILTSRTYYHGYFFLGWNLSHGLAYGLTA